MDDRMLDELISAVEKGGTVELAVVSATRGSAPRKAGACLALLPDGRALGTVGGGALERLVMREAAELQRQGASALRRHTIDGTGSDTGMICGGEVEVCLLALGPYARTGLEAARRARAQGDPSWLVVALGAGDKEPAGAHMAPAEPDAAILSYDAGRVLSPLATTAEQREALDEARREEGTMGVIFSPDAFTRALIDEAESCAEPARLADAFVLPLAAEGRAVVFGGGHVGASLVPVLVHLGFSVVLCDDRAELALPENYPAATEVLCAPYAELVERAGITRRDYVVVCTSGHASDAAIVTAALAKRPRYLGCLGSRKKTAFMKERLAEAGFDPDAIARLHMPVGLAIGAETPAEIAVSIAAEIVACRRGAAR